MNNTMVRVLQGMLILVMLVGSFGVGGCQTEPSTITPDQLTETVIGADLIVLGTITDKKYEVVDVGLNTPGVTPGKFAYTLFTLSVEKVIKGDPSIKEAIIRAEGGYINDEIYQGPTGRYFRISDHVLVGLFKQEDNVYIVQESDIEGVASSVFWIQGSANSVDPLEEIMGRICKILRVNGIPNSLNEPCPEPADAPASPPK